MDIRNYETDMRNQPAYAPLMRNIGDHVTTWGDIYNQRLRNGEDHGSAAYAADDWQKRQDQAQERLKVQAIERRALAIARPSARSFKTQYSSRIEEERFIMEAYQAVYDATRRALGHVDLERVAREAFDISWAVNRVEEAAKSAFYAYDRPSAVYRPTISLDGNMYCALYGEDLMSGCAGFGETMDAAMWDFDKNWREQKAPKMVAKPYKCPRCDQDFETKEASEGAAEGCRDHACPLT